MQPDEHDTLIWDSEIRRQRIDSAKTRPYPRRGIFILDDQQSATRQRDEDQRRPSE